MDVVLRLLLLVLHHERTAKAFNDAVVVDRENFGSAWPLQQLPVTTFADAVSAALSAKTKTVHTV